MAVECPCCGAAVGGKWDKIALVVGGGVVLGGPIAFALGVKGGLIALLAKATGVTVASRDLAKMKLQLMAASQRMGSFFVCKNGHDVSVEEVWKQL